jgi:hypothetical protein
VTLSLDIRPDGAVLGSFIASRARVKGIQGPVRSGKTFASWHSLLFNAASQPPAVKNAMGLREGVRYRRTLIIRETLKQAKDTVLKTARLVLHPEHFGEFTESGRPKLHIQKFGLDWELLVYGMDDPTAIADLKSLEVSDILASEARYLPREVLVACAERIGQFPPRDAGGCRDGQLIFDTNPPAAGSWLAVISGQSPVPEGLTEDQRQAYRRPEGWEIFIQPPGVLEVFGPDGAVTGYAPNPAAENLKNLPPNYYAQQIAGRSRDEIETELMNRPGSHRGGKSVWPQYRRQVHGASGLVGVEGHPVLVGVDFGRTPAAAIGQQVHGQWRVLRELVTENMGARAFARLLKSSMATWFPGFDYAVFGDPAGENLEQSDDMSPFKVMWAEGVRVVAAPGNNDWVLRRDAVDELLRRMVDGRPSFLVDVDKCPVLGAALSGAYAYPRLQTSIERYADRPLKNQFSHVADALQYLVLGGGEGRVLLQRSGAARAQQRERPQQDRVEEWDPYAV